MMDVDCVRLTLLVKHAVTLTWVLSLGHCSSNPTLNMAVSHYPHSKVCNPSTALSFPTEWVILGRGPLSITEDRTFSGHNNEWLQMIVRGFNYGRTHAVYL